MRVTTLTIALERRPEPHAVVEIDANGAVRLSGDAVLYPAEFAFVARVVALVRECSDRLPRPKPTPSPEE